MKWHNRFLELAKVTAAWSKDPSTKVGAVAVGEAKQVLAQGYNGIPRGVDDLPERMERPEKYLWTAHAEANAIAHAARGTLGGSTFYVTHCCCSSCAALIINAGVARVVIGSGQTHMGSGTHEAALTMFAEAGIEVVFVKKGMEYLGDA